MLLLFPPHHVHVPLLRQQNAGDPVTTRIMGVFGGWRKSGYTFAVKGPQDFFQITFSTGKRQRIQIVANVFVLSYTCELTSPVRPRSPLPLIADSIRLTRPGTNWQNFLAQKIDNTGLLVLEYNVDHWWFYRVVGGSPCPTQLFCINWIRVSLLKERKLKGG